MKEMGKSVANCPQRTLLESAGFTHTERHGLTIVDGPHHHVPAGSRWPHHPRCTRRWRCGTGPSTWPRCRRLTGWSRPWPPQCTPGWQQATPNTHFKTRGQEGEGYPISWLDGSAKSAERIRKMCGMNIHRRRRVPQPGGRSTPPARPPQCPVPARWQNNNEKSPLRSSTLQGTLPTRSTPKVLPLPLTRSRENVGASPLYPVFRGRAVYSLR